MIWHPGQRIFFKDVAVWCLVLLNHSHKLFSVPLKFALGAQFFLAPHGTALGVVTKLVWRFDNVIAGLHQRPDASLE